MINARKNKDKALLVIILLLTMPIGVLSAEQYNTGETLFLKLNLVDPKLSYPEKGNDLFFCDAFKGMYVEDFTGFVRDTITRYDGKGNILWSGYFPYRPTFSPDCKYIVMRGTATDTDGYIYDGETGRLLVHSEELLGYGRLKFSVDNKYILSDVQYTEPGDFSRAGAAVTSVEGKRILLNESEALGEPVFGGEYFVGYDAVYDKNGKIKWLLKYDEESGLEEDINTGERIDMYGFPVNKYPLLGIKTPKAGKVYISVRPFAKNGQYFIYGESRSEGFGDNREYVGKGYLGQWGKSGVARKLPIPNGNYAFFDDSSKLAIATTSQLMLFSVDGGFLWKKQLIDLARTDFPEHYLRAGEKFSESWDKKKLQAPNIGIFGDKIVVYYGSVYPSQPALMAGVYDKDGNLIDKVRLMFGDEGFEEIIHPGIRLGKQQFFLTGQDEYVRVHFKPNNVFEFYRGKLKQVREGTRNEAGKD